jgi:mono/diheme cytochrome c family protein
MSARWIAPALILALSVMLPEPVPAADALKGEAYFAVTCGRCHRAGGMGTGILSRRPGIAAQGLLEQREDLTVPFVQAVVRHGNGNMPRITRAEVSDSQLAEIADYLARGKK